MVIACSGGIFRFLLVIQIEWEPSLLLPRISRAVVRPWAGCGQSCAPPGRAAVRHRYGAWELIDLLVLDLLTVTKYRN